MTDVYLLTDVFEKFRDRCLNYYELDPSYYITLPNYSCNAFCSLTGIRLQQIHIKEMYEMIEVIVLFCLVCVSVPLLLYDFLIFALSNSSRFNGLWNSPTIWSSTSVHLHLKTPERPLRPALLEPSASAFGPIDRPSIGPPRRPARRRATSSSLWRLRLAVAGGRVLYGSFPGEEPRRVGGLVGDFR